MAGTEQRQLQWLLQIFRLADTAHSGTAARQAAHADAVLQLRRPRRGGRRLAPRLHPPPDAADAAAVEARGARHRHAARRGRQADRRGVDLSGAQRDATQAQHLRKVGGQARRQDGARRRLATRRSRRAVALAPRPRAHADAARPLPLLPPPRGARVVAAADRRPLPPGAHLPPAADGARRGVDDLPPRAGRPRARRGGRGCAASRTRRAFRGCRCSCASRPTRWTRWGCGATTGGRRARRARCASRRRRR